MNRIFLPYFAAFLVIAATPLPASDCAPMVSVKGSFLYATDAQMTAALKAAGLAELPAHPLSPEQFSTLRAKLTEDGAQFFGSPRSMTKSGMKTVVTSVREVRYPMQYIPSPKEPGRYQPTGFQSRNAGIELSFTPKVWPDGKVVSLSVEPTVTTFLGFIDYAGGKPVPAGASLATLLKEPLSSGGLWQPVFSAFTTKLDVDLHNGETVLVGGTLKSAVIPPPGQPVPKNDLPEQQVFVFITVRFAPQESLLSP
jgi:Flp pilus assembly secretin CpaC